MRILVTGGTGFVGRHLIRSLIGEGHEVHALVRDTSRVKVLGSDANSIRAHLLSNGFENIDGIVAAVEPHLTYHLASLSLAEHRREDVAPLISTNILLGATLADSLARHGADALVNVGTTWQHFHDEDYEPACLYAATKKAFADLLAYWTAVSQLRVVTIELFDSYGPADPRRKIVTLLLDAAKNGDTLELSPGDQYLSLVHVYDVARGLNIAGGRVHAAKPGTREVFVLDSDRNVTVQELAAAVERAAGRQLRIEWGGRPYRAREVMTPWSRGNRLPGWSPRISLEAGLERLWQRNVQAPEN